MADKASTSRPALDRELMECFIFGTARVRRFTQDSPVLPDVWLEYATGPDAAARLTSPTDANEPFPPVKLLLTPFRDAAAGEVASVVRKRLEIERRSEAWRAFGHDPVPEIRSR